MQPGIHLGPLDAAHRILIQAVADEVFPGATFGVIHGMREYTSSNGHFTYNTRDFIHCSGVNVDTIYDIASLTKVVATTSMSMLLHDRGQLTLDTPLETILPAFNLQHDAARAQVTLRMLLSHSSGLPAHEYLYRRCSNREEAIAACLTLPLEAEPGAKAVYSDIGFILLGLALEAIAGEPLDRFCTREVFQPLGMTSTFFNPDIEALSPRIPPTAIDTTFRHRILQGEVHDENAALLGGVAGHAGLFSNVPDLLRFARCILEGGQPLFRAETVALFTTRTSLPPGTSRALGWDTPTAPSSSGHLFSPHSAGHLGFTGTSLWLDMERFLAVVLLTNRTWREDGHEPAALAPSQEAIRRLRPVFHDAVLHALGLASPPVLKSP